MKTRHPIISLRLLAFAGAALLGVSTAHAQTVQLFNVDCNASGSNDPADTYSGAAVIGNTGDYWNALSSAIASSTLQTSTQAGPTITFTNNSISGSFRDTAGTVTNPALLMQDYIYNQSGSGTFTLGGLTAGASFSLVLYGAGDVNGQGSHFSLSGATGGNSTQTLTTSGVDRNISNGIGDAYNTFTGTVGTGGALTVTVASNGTTALSILDGVQFRESVPEPSTWALLGLGAAGLGVALRRRAART